MQNVLFMTLMLLIIIFSVYSLLNTDKPQNKSKLLVIIFVLWFLAVFRGSGDGDYTNYLEFSNYINSWKDVFDFRFPIELGFRIISFIKNSLNLPDQFIFLVMNSIIIFNVFFIILKQDYKFLSILIYLYFYLQFDLHATRTGVALSFSLLYFYYYNKKQYKQAITSFIFGLFFHKSIIIALLFIPIKKINEKIPNSIKLKLLLILLFISFLNIPIFAVNTLNFFGFKYLAGRILFYINSESFGYGMSIFDFRLAFFAIITIAFIYLDSRRKDFSKFSDLTLVSITNVLIILSCLSSTSLALRFSSYFSFQYILFIPQFIRSYSNANNNGTDRNMMLLLVKSIGIIFGLFSLFLLIRLYDYKFILL